MTFPRDALDLFVQKYIAASLSGAKNRSETACYRASVCGRGRKAQRKSR